MPDTWTVMFILFAALLFRSVESAEDDRVALRRYWVLAGTIALGALGTKLIPIVLLVPFLVVAVRDRRLRHVQRCAVLAAIPTSLALFALPYLASPFMVTNVFVRFEFDMLFSGAGVPTTAGLPTGRWYPDHADGLTVAVTEKRTKDEIDGLVGAVRLASG